jgi:Flp pilus assembly protein TadD
VVATPLLLARPRRYPSRTASTASARKVSTLFAQALACHRGGRIAKAITLYNRILSLKPDIPECHNNIGVALADLGKFEEAAAACRRATALKPDYTEAHSNLGIALANLGRPDEAVAAYRCAIAFNPDFAGAYSNLADTLRVMGLFEASEVACRKAIALRQDHPQAHANLGNTLKSLGRLDDAEAMLHRAVILDPDNAVAHSSLGTVLMDLCRPDEAEVAFRRAIALKPDCAVAYNNLGLVLKQVGRLTEARRAAERAVGLAPRKPSYFCNLGEVRRYGARDPYVAALEALAQDEASLSIDDQIHLHFALAKAYADIGRPEDGFRRLLAGNALKRSRIAYDEAAVLGRMDRVQAVFTPELVGASHITDKLSPIPIFIVGMPRSGTSLVEQILASHPHVFGGGELKLFERATAGIRPALRDSPEFPEMALHMSGEHFRALGKCYLAEIKRLAPAASRVTDKMPSNFLFAGLIHLALPNAIIIHTIRDPVDTCVSSFSKLFTEPQNHTYDLAELGRYCRRYQTLMAHWHHVLPPGRILDVRYEDVVDDLSGAARRIVAHCGLPWDENCLDFHRTERSVRTASAMQVRQPIYSSSIGRWRSYEAFLGPLLAELSGC